MSFPIIFYYLVGIILSILVGSLVYLNTDLGPLFAAVCGINAAGFFLFGYDKNAARRKSLRIPERFFFIFALCGATPGIVLAMVIFRHKIRDRTFLPLLTVILFVQILLVTQFW